MKEVIFITGNQAKADYLAKYLGYPVAHQKLDLDELQSLDLMTIVRHKVHQAYELVGKPVLVEDVALEFAGLNGLPGPFIKFFMERMLEEDVCSLVDGKDRSATARCVFGYYDGERLELLEGHLDGRIAEKPDGDGGYGWDRIFIPRGYDVPRAALCQEDDQKTYVQIKPFGLLKTLLEGLD